MKNPFQKEKDFSINRFLLLVWANDQFHAGIS